jgi:hypothetical protein
MTAIPFSSLQHFLEGLGFQARSVPGSYARFEHPASGAWIMLRHYQLDEAVSPTDLAVVRHTLDAFCILDRSRFDDALRECALAG